MWYLRRVGQSVIALVLLVMLVFLASRLLGDPATLLTPIDATPQQIEDVRARLGLDRSVAVQLGDFAAGLAQGDLGTSFRTGGSVSEAVLQRLPATLRLAMASFAVSVILSLVLGLASAYWQDGRLDRITQFVMLAGFAMPPFWVGLLLAQVFGVRLGFLPITGSGSLRAYVLPVATLSLSMTAQMMRLVRSSAMAELVREYVDMARLKGMTELGVVLRDVLPNAILPVLTYGAVIFSQLLTGAVVVEVVFSWPGLGRLVVDSIGFRDYPVVQGVVLMTGLIVILLNLAVDAMTYAIDPRVRRA